MVTSLIIRGHGVEVYEDNTFAIECLELFEKSDQLMILSKVGQYLVDEGFIHNYLNIDTVTGDSLN